MTRPEKEAGDQSAGLYAPATSASSATAGRCRLLQLLTSQRGHQRVRVVHQRRDQGILHSRSDTGSYSDLVFEILELLGISYRPALADLPDQKGWRIDPHADYGR
jgi:hypothetical protein